VRPGTAAPSARLQVEEVAKQYDRSQGEPLVAIHQSTTTALTINDLLGGELLVAEVLRADGSRQGVHWWNRLPDGTEIDLIPSA
jgi:hypothetical protein